LIEIRFHGRGGQGAVTASRIIAIAAYEEGQYSQAIPMYGTERRGAPLTAFVRIDEQRVRERELVHNPDISIVLDPLIAKQQAVVNNLKVGGLVLLNTQDNPEDIQLGGDFKVATVDATTIALETLGRPITNTAILGAFSKVSGIIKLESIEKAIMKTFPGRLGEMNIAAVRGSYERVKGPIQAPVKDAPEQKIDINVGGYGVLKDVSSWRVFTPEIDIDKCIGCKNCWVFCPETAFNWDETTNKPSIRYNACKGCGVCANECPVNAIDMVRVEAY
jgi:2-oxoacid:acceptor oxidoreductase gamma subunit (pyruvate/2-ketoisovalerate family)/2-oxoacid:acceptor oxidoreductase delta subunit (pyruvate/2-ketoisovalerate family)